MPTSQAIDGDYDLAISTPTKPRQMLLGQTLASGWRLDQILKPTKNSSGGNFGTGYIATRGEEIAFVKAVDFVDALTSDDPMTHLSKLIAESNFEKDVLQYCTERGMNRVLRYIGHEYLGSGADPLNRVSCLIMEAGDQDLRRLINNAGTSTCSWSLFALHDVIKAVVQLHKGGIAHQDVKPSNVIAVREAPARAASGSTPMKIGDLGRVVRQNGQSPFNGSPWSGDRRYPPQLFYPNQPHQLATPL